MMDKIIKDDNLQLSPPWVTYYKELQMLLGRDKEIYLVFDQEEMKIKVYVDNIAKAEALEQVLAESKTFGNVTVNVEVIPSNNIRYTAGGNVYDDAFDGNPAYSYFRETALPVMGGLCYVVWAREIVQFFNDNLADVNGNATMLYEQIATDVLKAAPGVYHCTAGPLNAPLGEWP